MITSTSLTLNVDDVRNNALSAIHVHWKLFLSQGILMLCLGIVAVVAPNVSTVDIELLVGYLFAVGGVFRAVTVFRKRKMPGFWWHLWNATLAIIVGAVMIARPVRGVVSLTIALAIFFVIEGVAAMVVALKYRGYLPHWFITLFSGCVNLVLAFLIWQGWPNSATWIIGLYVGINMFFVGLQLIMLSIAARNSDFATK